jgi:hypothetical protein
MTSIKNCHQAGAHWQGIHEMRFQFIVNEILPIGSNDHLVHPVFFTISSVRNLAGVARIMEKEMIPRLRTIDQIVYCSELYASC